MNSFGNGVKRLAVAAAVFAAVGTVQAATVSECRALVGFNASYGAWGAVSASHDSFLGNKTVGQCEVKVVGTSPKGKPPTTTLTLEGPMAQDQCSMYNYLSSVDSKLNQAKVGDAYVNIGSMIVKVNELFATGKLREPGYTSVLTSATAVQACILELMTQ